MNLETFLAQRRPSWQQLESLLTQIRTNIRRLSAQELAELGRLYQSTASDLALAQRDFPQQRVTYYLNGLVSRAHAQIYQEPPLRRQALKHFYRQQFPLLYRSLLPYTSLSFCVFFVAALLAFGITWRQPAAIYVFAGAEIEPLVRQVEAGQLWTAIAPSARSAASSMILTNNIRVMFLTFAGGITAGLLTLWVILSNGLHIGAIFGLLQAHGLSGGLGEFVLAHGFIELSVIFLAGGCGLFMGDGLLRPGLLTRRAALVQRSRMSVQLILGCIPLLILAGLIEGFISPSGLPWWIKLAVGLSTGILLHAYWLFDQVTPAEPS
ncbi:MAG: stage II sporulation protein M [Caldilineaceae bacterium]|nr:stage II sporulation protein M [Caldilineaceae bacterium]